MQVRVGERKLNYDLVFLSCLLGISSILKNIPELIKGLCKHAYYTIQMSIGFLASENIPKFSFILSFNHLIHVQQWGKCQ